MIRKKNSFILLILLTLMIIPMLSNSISFASNDVVDNINELQVKVNNSVEGEIIILGENFISGDIVLEIPDKNIIIDGNNIQWKNGSTTIRGVKHGSITIKNIKYNGANIDKRIINIENEYGKVIFDNIEITGAEYGAMNINTGLEAKTELSRVWIHNNIAEDTAPAVYLGKSSNVDIRNSTIEDNTGSGTKVATGAISSEEKYKGNLDINNTIFRKNINESLSKEFLGGGGGAMAFHYYYGNINITECIFDGNRSSSNISETSDGGAIYIFDGRDNATVNIDRTTFFNNIATDDGGAIMFRGTGNPGMTTSIVNSTFYKNKAYGLGDTDYAGGAIQYFKNGGSAKMTNNISSSTFVGNESGSKDITNEQRGGAIGLSGAGMFAMAAVTRNNSLFKDNKVYNANGLNNSSNYKDISNYATTQVNKNNVINVDKGDSSAYSNKDIFGIDSPILQKNYSSIFAGVNDEVIMTIPIKPEGIADNTYINSSTNPPPLPEVDQRGYNRYKDQGAVEMSWIKYHANSGYYDVSKENLPPFTGEGYYNTNNVENIIEYYRIGKNGESTTVYIPKHLSKEDHIFKGWSTSKDADEPDEEYRLGKEIKYTDENLTLYAVWEKEKKYTVTYVGDGEEEGTPPIDENSPYKKDSIVTVLGNNGMTKENHTFLGWSADGTEGFISENSTFTITRDIILTAVWETNEIYQVMYDANGADTGAVIDNTIYFDGSIATVMENSNDNGFERKGYTFINWNTNSDGSGKKYEKGDSLTVYDNVTLYAQWEKNKTFKVTYDGNENTTGKIPIDDTEYFLPEDNNVTVKELGDLKKENHTFEGWNTKSDGSGINYYPWDNFNIDDDIILYANWKELPKYTIKYDGNGNTSGKVPIDKNSPYYQDEKITILDKGNLEKKGYKFLFWSTEADGFGTTFYPGDTPPITYDATLYAIWHKVIPEPPTKPTSPIEETKPSGSIKDIILIGGKATLTTEIEKQLDDFNLDRISGPSRYETAIEISKGYSKSDIVILASGEKYTDELTGAVLANKLEAPILLTTKDKILKNVIKEIERLKATKIIVIGGNGTISVDSLKALSKYEIERIGGVDRYETSVLIGNRVRKLAGNKHKAILVDGTNFPDAIAMTSMAVEQGLPILLTEPEKINKTVDKAVKDWGLEKVTIGGGKASVSENIENALKEKVKVDRISGSDRYETSVLVAKEVYKNPTHIVLASGELFSDSIVGVPYAVKNKYPLVLSRGKDVPKVVREYIVGK